MVQLRVFYSEYVVALVGWVTSRAHPAGKERGVYISRVLLGQSCSLIYDNDIIPVSWATGLRVISGTSFPLSHTSQ